MSFTIRSFLKLPALDGIKLSAGSQGLNHLIRNVNILDHPDSFDWLQPGDLILTTGFVFGNNPADLKKLIDELSALSCSGLCIKTKRFWEEVPEAIIDAANNKQFPIIEIPLAYSFSKIIDIVIEQTKRNEDSLLQRHIKNHNELLSCLLSGGNLEEVTKRIVEMINNPLIVVDSKWNLLSYADHEDNRYRLNQTFILIEGAPVFPRSFLDSLPKDILNYRKAIKRTIRVNGVDIACRILPIRAMNEHFGYLVAWESVSKLYSIEYMALEQAATIVAFDRIKHKEVEESKQLLRKDFINDLLSGRITSQSALHSLSETYGLNPDRKYACFVIKVNQANGISEDQVVLWRNQWNTIAQKIISIVEAESVKENRRFYSVYRGNIIICFLQLNNEDNPAKLEPSLTSLFENIYGSTKINLPNTSLIIGIGRGIYDLFDIRKSFLEAQESISLQKILPVRTNIIFYENQSVFRLLLSIKSPDQIQDFFSSTIKKLVDYDTEKGTDLLHTLDVFLGAQMNVSNAAKEMFLHRNTLAYRVEKIQSILQVDFTNSEEILKLQLGLRIWRIMQLGKDETLRE